MLVFEEDNQVEAEPSVRIMRLASTTLAPWQRGAPTVGARSFPSCIPGKGRAGDLSGLSDVGTWRCGRRHRLSSRSSAGDLSGLDDAGPWQRGAHSAPSCTPSKRRAGDLIGLRDVGTWRCGHDRLSSRSSAGDISGPWRFTVA